MHCRIPATVRPRDYDRTAVMRLIHESMGIPVSPPATSEESEVESESSPSRPASLNHSLSQPEQPSFNPQLIRIDERTMQLHFTPFYFGKSVRFVISFILFGFCLFRTFRYNVKYENK